MTTGMETEDQEKLTVSAKDKKARRKVERDKKLKELRKKAIEIALAQSANTWAFFLGFVSCFLGFSLSLGLGAGLAIAGSILLYVALFYTRKGAD